MSTIAPYPTYRDVDLPWLNQVPQHWATIPLGRVATFRNGSDYAEVEVAEGGYPVYGSGGAFRRASSFLYDGESVLFGRKGTIDRPVHVTGRFWTVDTMYYTELKPTIVGKYLFYYATVLPYSYYSTNTALPSMTQGSLAGHAMPLPPLDEQRAIADFLDRETGQIDRLIEKQEQLIDILRERRAAAIWYAVAVSGEGWTLDRLGRHSRVGNGSTPSRENLRYWSGGSNPWLNSGSVNRGRIDSSDQFVTDLALRECHLPLVSPGSVLVALTGQGKTRGTAAPLDIEATVSQHLAYVTPDRSHWNAEYLFYALTASYDHLRMVSDENGSTKGGLTCQDLKAFKLPLRGLDEQRVIADHLDDQTDRIDVLIGRVERFIGLARERRAALVSAAVTGRIDVRGAV